MDLVSVSHWVESAKKDVTEISPHGIPLVPNEPTSGSLQDFIKICS